jgi:hypothetical protein
MRAVVSLIVAVVGAVVGDILVWGGGTALSRSLASLRPDPAQQILPSVFTVLGLLFLAAAMLSAAWSSLGVVVVGIFQIVVGLAIVVLPVAIWVRPLTSVESISRPVGEGLESSWASGVGLLTGVVFFVGGIALATRRARPGAAGRAVTTIIAVLLGAGIVLLLAYGGGRLLFAIQQFRGGIEVLGVVFVLLAAVAMAVVIAGVRWSSLGPIVLGVLLVALGAASLWSTAVQRLVIADRALVSGIGYVGGTGGYLVLGVLVLVAGIAGLIRGARRRAAESAIEPDERIGYRQEQPGDDGPAWPPFPAERTNPPPDAPPAERV